MKYAIVAANGGRLCNPSTDRSAVRSAAVEFVIAGKMISIFKYTDDEQFLGYDSESTAAVTRRALKRREKETRAIKESLRYSPEMCINDIEEMLEQYGGPTETEALEALEDCDPENNDGDDLRVLAERVGQALRELQKLKR